MKAMILSAGKGTRLGKITESIPKVLVDINGKSLLRRAVEKCVSHGFDDIIINVHHFAGLVEEEIVRLRREGFRISISDEREELLDTGGGLYRARHFFDRTPFLLYNADIITDFDLGILLDYHLEKGGLATLVVRHRPGTRFLLIDSEGLLRGWCNKQTGERIISRGSGENLSEIAFSSMALIDPEIFSYMSEGVYSMTPLYLQLAAERNIYTLLSDSGYWFNAGTPEILEEVRKFLV
ncbi:MAG TPA: nucleotidyltransferase family protein [Bacteroidales bacterium]|jgi:NDP-sugar pyrophosphorylase family protein|nr:nucleotidyltransferase family protein [Bacteroidales bacterium]HQH25220.1 nucleotidyltransferase family protein [Bacteroidales bacterium]HQJ82783.1 nucleotidyltransferase family protein [Bacteroidales bacterium]